MLRASVFLFCGVRFQVLNIVETVNPRSTIIRVVEESKPGKRAAMYTGLAYVDTEITVFADDDALYGPAVLKSLIMPFKDPAMGGCGTRQIARPKADTFKFEDIMMVSCVVLLGGHFLVCGYHVSEVITVVKLSASA